MFCFHQTTFWRMSLPTAGLLVGLINAILAFLGSVLFIAMLVFLNEFVTAFRDGPPSALLEFQHLQPVLGVILTTWLVFKVLNFVASIRLIIGIPRKAHVMLQWLIWNAIGMIFKIPITIGLSYLAYSTSNIPDCVIQSLIFMIVLQCWMWTGVYSLYRSTGGSKVAGSDWMNANKVLAFGNIDEKGLKGFKN